LQKRLIPLFHYALNPGGVLFLGTSEGVGEFHRPVCRARPQGQAVPAQAGLRPARNARARARGSPMPPPPGRCGAAAFPRRPALAEKLPLRELTEQALLQQVAPAGALVNAQGDILYLHGRTGCTWSRRPGEAGVNNILKMAREGLRRA
jgi:two-component system CheB/CheR fusion protein